MVKRSSDYITGDTIDLKTAEWLEAVYSVNYRREHLIPHPSRCALLVIDMVRYFTDPGHRAFLPASEAIVPRIAALLEAWRTTGGMVVFTRHCHQGQDDLGMLGTFFSDHIRCGYPEAEIIDALTPRPHETVIRKNTYDAFLHTGLEEMLRLREISQVLVTGVLTQMCCETTARAAFTRGFETFVAADATASFAESFHLNSLTSLASCAAVITSGDEVLDRCNTTT